MHRIHSKRTCTQTTWAIPSPLELREWLAEQARQHGLRWLLAHTDSGVIWGDLRTDGLHLSSAAFPLAVRNELDWETMQQARLFAEHAELLVWYDGRQWQATLHEDTEREQQASEEGSADTRTHCLDEPYLLWGYSKDNAPQQADGFYLLKEGTRGIQHAPPVNASEAQRASVWVRHYLREDEATGLLYIAASRLVRLEGGAST